MCQSRSSIFCPPFGKLNYHGYVGAVSENTWRKDLLKVSKYIKKAIYLNVNTDALHRKQISDACDDLTNDIREAQTLYSVNAAVIEHLVRIIFLLLGNMPDHWNRRSPYSDVFWRLNGHRSLTYSQSEEQKVYLLINAIDIEKITEINLQGFQNLHEAFYVGFKSNSSEFLIWFKQNYPTVYCQVF